MGERRREEAVGMRMMMLSKENNTCDSAYTLFPPSDTRSHSLHQPSITSKPYLEPVHKAAEEPL